MRVTKQTDRYVILDDVLAPEQFELMIVEDLLGRPLLPEKRHMRDGRHAVPAVSARRGGPG